VGGLTAVLTVPLVVAVAVQRTPTWYPALDLAEIELHVRDVGTLHTPLIGLGGRIAGWGKHGSHPGPISFYALAPVYRLLGGSSWALQVSAVAVNAVAIGLAIWLGLRRWGTAGAVATAAGLALLMHNYGFALLTVPWNPHFPIMWWPVVLLSVWAVLCEDLVGLPLLVLAGSMCAQTHVPYVGIVAGMSFLAVGTLVVRAVRARRSDPDEFRHLLRWLGLGAGLAFLLWLPPLIEQVSNHPGNIAVLIENFTSPTEDPAGLGGAWDAVLRRGNPLVLLTNDPGVPATAPTIVLLVLWLGAVATAARVRDSRLLRLHAVVGASLVLAVVSISRIFGPMWVYLTYWLSGTIMLTVGAVVATAAVVTARVLDGNPQLAERVRLAVRGSDGAPRAARALGVAGLAALAVVPTGFAVDDATDATTPEPHVSAALRRLAPDTAEALASGDVPGGGRDGRYVVTWVDPVDLGSTGISLLLDLERRGFDAYAPYYQEYQVAVGKHRTRRVSGVDAEVHVAVGDAAIEDWRPRRNAVEVARYEPRTRAERAEAGRLQRAIVDRLKELGEDELAYTFEVSRMGTYVEGADMPPDVGAALYQLSQIPTPVSVFVRPR
jgi:hypothetical protein